MNNVPDSSQPSTPGHSTGNAMERHEFEQALRKKDLELERAIRAKDRFLAGMSHEMRTPLTAIIGFTGTMLMELPGPLTGEQVEQLTTIKTSAKHLLSLITNLLDLVEIESGDVTLLLDIVECVDVVEDVVACFVPLAANKGLTLELTKPDSEVQVRVDRRVLGQILFNLVDNAIKFTDAGHVTVAIDSHGGDDISQVAISVSDTGVGIAESRQERLFEALASFNLTAMDRAAGVGLGIHLSQKLARLMGGDITLSSAQGRGSTFTLTVPAA